jgi:hypothetical protein
MKKIFSLLVSIFSVTILFSQTNLPSVISKDTILTRANSPYLITGNMTINSGVTLTIEAGVTIKFGSMAKITVSGNLIAEGTRTDSIYLTSNIPGVQWDKIANNGASLIEMHYVKTTDNKMFVFGNYGNTFVISHCNIVSTARGNGEDCIAIEYAKRVVIEYITLKGAGGKIADGIKNDAIDIDACDSCFISYSHIYNFSDDVIDIGTNTKYAYIHDNILHNSNYGVTVGESSKAYLVNNISYYNDGGFQVHTGATIYCENNTLFANTVGIETFHSEEGQVKQTGGTAIIKNTIFSNSTDRDIYYQTSSIVDISYSISDKDSLPGNNNLRADPLLNDPQNGDFSLKAGSPCINAGIDSIGNEINMGALLPEQPPVLVRNTFTINQINVYPNPTCDYIIISESAISKKANSILLYDINGKVILIREIIRVGNSINVSSLPEGIYFVKVIYNDNSSAVAKFVKR